MKKSVLELNVNPINPRRISAARRLMLKQSILLFPKMLDVRDIVVNKDGLVLAGNQRVSALADIARANGTALERTLSSSQRYAALDDEGKRAIIDYWLAWQENPEVEVTVSEFTPEEEREFLIKDNKEFGEFDAEVLQRTYDKAELIEYGVDDDITALLDAKEQVDLTDEDEDAAGMQDEEEPAEKAKDDDNADVPYEILKVGKYRIPVTEQEYNRLYGAWIEWMYENGGNELFIQHLLDRRKTVTNKLDKAD